MGALFGGAGVFQHDRESTDLDTLAGAGRTRPGIFAGFAVAALALKGRCGEVHSVREHDRGTYLVSEPHRRRRMHVCVQQMPGWIPNSVASRT